MKRRPTTLDVANLAGVSKTTVSFVLNQRKDIAIPEETRERVLAAARELGYRPNRIALNLSRGKTQTIGIIMFSIDKFFVEPIMHGIEEVCTKHGHQMLLTYATGGDKGIDKYMNFLTDYKVDGLMIIASGSSKHRVEQCIDDALLNGTPCVCIDERDFSDKADSVVSDDIQGARRAVEHLLEMGHTRIAMLSGGKTTSAARDRYLGYLSALREAGIPIDEQLIVGDSFEYEETMEASALLLSLPDPPTAVFAANDYLAAGMSQIASEHGVRVPEDLAMIGYSDTAVSQWLRLTTVCQGPESIGRRASEALFERIQNPDRSPVEIMLPTNLVVRKSCGTQTVDEILRKG